MRKLWSSYRASYSGLPRAAWLLAGAQLVNASGTMVVFFLTLYLTKSLGFTLETAGNVMSGYGLGMAAGTLAGGALADRLGPYSVQRLSLVGTAALLMILGASGTFPTLLAAAVLWGFFNAALFPANATAMAAVCPEPVRARGFVLNRLANNLGATIGPVVGGLLARRGYRSLFWVDAGTSLVAAILLHRLFPGRGNSARGPEPARSSRLRWCRDRVLVGLLAAALGLSIVIAQVFSEFAPYLKNVESFSEPAIGILFAVNTALIVVAQMPIIHAVQRFTQPRTASVGALLFAAGFTLMSVAHGPMLMALAIAVWTFGEMLAFPSLMTAVSLRAPPGEQGRYQGLHALAFSLGMTAGPTLGARLSQARGFATLWLTVGALALVVAVLLAVLPEKVVSASIPERR